VVGFPRFDDDAIDVHLDNLPDEVVKASLDAALICCPSILEAEGHPHVAVRAEQGDR
jgi:hypothetical protein